MNRQSGVLLPLFSLPGKYGCGTMGENAMRWIDLLSDSGFSWWQVLPLCMTDPFHSPYASCSSFGGDPLWIDPAVLYEQGLVTKEELSEQTIDFPYLCDYETLARIRLPFLKKAASRVISHEDVVAFIRRFPMMDQVCRYFALRDLNRGNDFRTWTVTETDPETLFAWRFIQYEFHRQWESVHAHARKKGISILGDLPFYVSRDSYELWAKPELFQLDARADPAFVAGVPPDYFSKDGQKWGNPLYDWDKMEQDGFSYWKDRLKYNLSLYDGVRIDHFRALAAYWSIPSEAKTAKDGKWVKGPGKKFIDAIRPLAGDRLILAEDLGIIDDDTRALLKYSGFPGMAVLQFAFDGDPNNTHLPHNYKESLAAYTGTHDNNTLLGFCWELSGDARREAASYLGESPDLFDGAMRALWMSKARLVIAPVQDLLRFGADTRINTPGLAKGNWRVRVTWDQLSTLDPARLSYFNRLYGR